MLVLPAVNLRCLAHLYLSPEQRVPAGHPLRPIRAMVDQALGELAPRFDRMRAQRGRPAAGGLGESAEFSEEGGGRRAESGADRGNPTVDFRGEKRSSQRVRQPVEEGWGWRKPMELLRRRSLASMLACSYDADRLPNRA